jgi:hypothetical protein
MNIQTHRSQLNNCQFIIPTENSNVGRVKISQPNLAFLAAHRINIKYIFESFVFFLEIIFFN